MPSNNDNLFLKQKVCGVKDVPCEAFIQSFAQHLKRQGKLEMPAWVDYVKTGKAKELAPYDPDWLYVRAASLARKVYIRKGTGVGAFSKVYGRKNRNGVMKNKCSTSSKKVIRYLLQQLGDMGLVEVDQNGGRALTPEGNRELDLVAGRVATEMEGSDDEE